MNYIEAVKKCINYVKEQYMLPIYDLEFVSTTESNNIQFMISEQLFLEMLLMEIRGKTIAYRSYKNQKEKANFIKGGETTGRNQRIRMRNKFMI